MTTAPQFQVQKISKLVQQASDGQIQSMLEVKKDISQQNQLLEQVLLN